MFGSNYKNYNLDRTRMGYRPHSDKEAQWAFYKTAKWSLKFSLIPRTCALSGRAIWLEYAYRGVAVYTGPGFPIEDVEWHSKHEHLIFQLKRA